MSIATAALLSALESLSCRINLRNFLFKKFEGLGITIKNERLEIILNNTAIRVESALII